jgi:hypothetical protein
VQPRGNAGQTAVLFRAASGGAVAPCTAHSRCHTQGSTHRQACLPSSHAVQSQEQGAFVEREREREKRKRTRPPATPQVHAPSPALSRTHTGDRIQPLLDALTAEAEELQKLAADMRARIRNLEVRIEKKKVGDGAPDPPPPSLAPPIICTRLRSLSPLTYTHAHTQTHAV